MTMPKVFVDQLLASPQSAYQFYTCTMERPMNIFCFLPNVYYCVLQFSSLLCRAETKGDRRRKILFFFFSSSFFSQIDLQSFSIFFLQRVVYSIECAVYIIQYGVDRVQQGRSSGLSSTVECSSTTVEQYNSGAVQQWSSTTVEQYNSGAVQQCLNQLS